MNGRSNRNLPSFQNKSSLDQLYSSKEFELLLKRERARADRSASNFSLIVYAINGLTSKKNHLGSFLQVMRRRIRTIDEIGWFQDHSIGVLLPFTDRKGASLFAEDVVKKLSKKEKPIPYSVFSYPSHWYKSSVWDQIGKGQRPANMSVTADPKEKDGRPRARLRKQDLSANVSAAIDEKIDSVLVRNYPVWRQVVDVIAKEFQGILRRERARADRAGDHFALIAIGLSAHPEEKHELPRLVQALRQRIRVTDVLGWLDDQTLSILLPGTDLEGAKVFIGNFSKQYLAGRQPAPVTVFCYPDHWLQKGNSSKHSRNEVSKSRDQGFEKLQLKMERSMTMHLPAWKRILDIAGSLLGLVFSSPIFLVLSAYIKIVSPGPIFFKQQRVGYGARPFTFLKFRTMCAGNDPGCHQAHLKELINSDKPMEKLDNGRDPRIIAGGRILRKACIDEIPQLVNVFKGEMSLVGPRPCLPYEAEDYLRWHSHRFDVLPGMTGLWQVSGKNKLTFKQMIRLDISYCQNMSLWLDLKILLLTIPTVVGLIAEGVTNRLNRAAQVPRTTSSKVRNPAARQI
jgi:lipopolysaccharide/colanic/teichoic acid biosynthesis glycosyltransferase